MKRLASCLLWVAASWLVTLAARLERPRLRRVLEADGVDLRPIAELPREQTFAPPGEWWPVLSATHPLSEIQTPRVRA